MRPLTYILVFVFLTCVFTLTGQAASVSGNTITLSDDEMVKCANGCILITKEALDELQRRAKAKNLICV